MAPSADESPAGDRLPNDSADDPDKDDSLEQLGAAFSEMLGNGLEGAAAKVADSTGEDTVTEENSMPEDADAAELSAVPPSSEADPIPVRIIEAMLFVGHPENTSLSKDQIARAIHGVKPEEVEGLVAELSTEYRESGTPYEIVYDDGGFRMVLREEFEKIRTRFYGPVREAKLSQAAVEVLALVAYNQPTTSETISKLRGHPSGSILSQLVRRQLLRFEKPEKKPRTPIYRTTPRFLKLFGLGSLEELPKNQELET